MWFTVLNPEGNTQKLAGGFASMTLLVMFFLLGQRVSMDLTVWLKNRMEPCSRAWSGGEVGENDKDRLQKATNARIQQLLPVGHKLDLVN